MGVFYSAHKGKAISKEGVLMKHALIFGIMAFVLVFGAGCDDLPGSLSPTPVIEITSQPAPLLNVTAGTISGNLTVAASVTEGAILREPLNN